MLRRHSPALCILRAPSATQDFAAKLFTATRQRRCRRPHQSHLLTPAVSALGAMYFLHKLAQLPQRCDFALCTECGFVSLAQLCRALIGGRSTSFRCPDPCFSQSVLAQICLTIEPWEQFSGTSKVPKGLVTSKRVMSESGREQFLHRVVCVACDSRRPCSVKHQGRKVSEMGVKLATFMQYFMLYFCL